jgi:tRNA A-37 threonylcarbamoyl transferase component Bud32
VTQVDAKGFAWRVDESIAMDQLLNSLSDWSEGKVLRRTPKRCVKLVTSGGRSLVVKHFYHGVPGQILKALFRGTPAAAEWTALREALAAGVPTCQPLGWGEKGEVLARESVLVTRALENVVSLRDCLSGPNRVAGRLRWQVLGKVAALVRKAHDRGFYLRDLHAGNILVRLSAAGVEAYLVDLQGHSKGRSLSLRERWKDLARFHGGSTEASHSDGLRFLRCYLSQPTLLDCSLRPVIRELESRGLRHRHMVWQKRQKRCVRDNRDFVRVKTAAFFGFARREYWNEDFVRLVGKPERVLELPGTGVVKDSKTTTVGLNRDLPQNFYIKRYNYQGLAYAAKDLFRYSRARRTWIAANSLHMRGIPVALPLAYLERRRRGILLESYILTKAKSGEALRDIFRRYDKSGYRFQEKRMLLETLARMIRKLHRNGVVHRDLKASNLIVCGARAGGYKLHIVDFDGIDLGVFSRRKRIKNLARLAQECQRHTCFTRSDRLRFLTAYLGARDKNSWKWLWSRVRSKV